MSLNKKNGFTIIELVVVIAILAIISAIGLSKFIDLSAQAKLANLQKNAMVINMASQNNYYAKKTGGTGFVLFNSNNVCTKSNLELLVSNPNVLNNYTFSGVGDCSVDQVSVACTINDAPYAVDFTLFCVR